MKKYTDHYGRNNSSELGFQKGGTANNMFTQNGTSKTATPFENNLAYGTRNGSAPFSGAAHIQEPSAFHGDMAQLFDFDALNKGFREAEYGGLVDAAILAGTPPVNVGLMRNEINFGMPMGNHSTETEKLLPKDAFDNSAVSNRTAITDRKTYNPYAEYVASQQNAGSGSGSSFVQANMQGPTVATPVYIQNSNQPHLPLQMPGIIPTTFPPLPYGVNKSIMKKKGVKATAYDIMTDFVTRIPVFTHGQNVYIYDSLGGFYDYKSQYEVERIIMDIYREKVKENGSGTLIEKTYKLLLKEPQIVRNETPLSDPTKISFRNCTVDLQNQMMLPHSPENVVTHAVNCDLARFNGQSEECPVFDKFLDDITGGDYALKQRIWEVWGYCLTSDRNAKKYFLLQGVPNSGKSLFCNLLSDFFAEGKVSALNIHSLKEKFSMGHLNDVVLCVSPDLPASALDPKSASSIKQLTGNDKISAPVKYKNNTQFRFEGKLILATNYPLLTDQPDDAFMQRAVVIPFLYETPEAKRDGDLLERLRAEKPAIASKALDAYFRLRNNHYKFSGDFVINSSVLYPEDGLDGPEIMPLVYNYLLNGFEKDPEGLVAIESAYEIFSQEVSNQFTEKMFSSVFQRLAEEIYGANRIRSYHGGRYKNARSSMEGIRFKNMRY